MKYRPQGSRGVMRGHHFIQKSILGLLVSICAVVSFADQGAKNRDYLIEKLNKVYLSLAPMDPSRVSITLRLADLLAERARIQSMEELDSGCVQCVAGGADRKKALSLYNDVLTKVPEASKGKVMVQMGHLNQLLGNDSAAIALYGKIANEAMEPMARAEASLAIAEINYKKNQWHEAQKSYEKVLAVPNASSRGFAAYRRAWSLFNQGQWGAAKTALVEILKTPALLSKTGTASNQIDVGFQEEVAADLATFVGRDFAKSDLSTVYDLSPEKTKIVNLTTVAAELERTGKKGDALEAWSFVYQYQSQPQDRIQTQAHLAALTLEMGQREAALTHFEGVYALAQQLKTTFSKEVEEARKTMKVAIVTWNQAEKKNPTLDLLSAYEGYLSSFGFEKEMNQWAVQLGTTLKQYERAWKQHQAALGHLQGAELENHLLLGIELGEQSGSAAILASAQNLYLEKSPSKSKEWEVRYQQAYRQYESIQTPADAQAAIKQLTSFARSAAAPLDLRVKAADLSLDAMAAQKDDAGIELAAKTFFDELNKVKGFNRAQNTWLSLAQKSILNQSAQLAALNDNNQAWAKLQNFQIGFAEEADKTVYLKNKMALAEKKGDLSSALAAAQDLSLLNSASAADKNLAAAKMAHYMDLRMDFKGAMAATQVLPESLLAGDRKALKLALYAELTGGNSTPYLKKFIELAKSEEEKAVASAELVKKASDFEGELKKQSAYLIKTPEVMASMILDRYLEKPSLTLVSMVEKEERLAKTSSGKILLKDHLLKELQTQKSALAAHMMDSSQQKTIVKSIKDRAKLLESYDKLAAKAISSGDWTAQVVALTVVGKESDRFYNEILSLPLPEGLSDEEQGEYMNLLGQQAAPYRNKADMAMAKVKEFWSASWKESLQTASVMEMRLVPVFENEVKALSEVALDGDRNFFSGLKPQVASTQKPVLAELEAARNNLRNKPMDRLAVENLLKLESLAGNKAMVQYLEGRLANMNLGVQ